MTEAPVTGDPAGLRLRDGAATQSPPQSIHHHDWVIREAWDTESGIATRWFACGLCGSYCT